MNLKIKSALCLECNKEQVNHYKSSRLCTKCYKKFWAKNNYQKNQKKMREKARIYSIERKRKLGKDV